MLQVKVNKYFEYNTDMLKKPLSRKKKFYGNLPVFRAADDLWLRGPCLENRRHRRQGWQYILAKVFKHSQLQNGEEERSCFSRVGASAFTTSFECTTRSTLLKNSTLRQSTNAAQVAVGLQASTCAVVESGLINIVRQLQSMRGSSRQRIRWGAGSAVNSSQEKRNCVSCHIVVDVNLDNIPDCQSPNTHTTIVIRISRLITQWGNSARNGHRQALQLRQDGCSASLAV